MFQNTWITFNFSLTDDVGEVFLVKMDMLIRDLYHWINVFIIFGFVLPQNVNSSWM